MDLTIKEVVMREIKFRAWLKKDKLMVDVIEWINNGRIGISINDAAPYIIQPLNYELMQYTGLKDKNGKEIYEGDKVNVLSSFNGEVADWLPTLTVAWDDANAQFVFTEPVDWELSWDEITECEVIGNIYENPELLDV